MNLHLRTLSHGDGIIAPEKKLITMQQEPFSTIAAKPAKQSLVIGKAGKHPLTKNQMAFNKLTERIEKLHKEIERKHELFEGAIKLYSQKVFPIQKEMILQKRKMLDVLWQNYQTRKLSATDQRNLKIILQEHLHEYLTLLNEKPDEKLKQIFREIEGETYEAFAKREDAMKKAVMQEMLDNLDVDIDMDEVDFSDENDLKEKLAEAQEKLQEQQDKKAEEREQRKKNKKKTKAQLEKEQLKQAVTESKQKNISTIYKQLAKLFHPDLEQDELRRAEKEILMKELTAAYEAKNLHALLTLELKWIHNENDHLESLTDEKLAVYLQILREQAEGLERQKNELFLQPRYAVLYNEFGDSIIRQPLATVEEVYKDLKNSIADISRDIADYASDFGLRHIKEMIKQWKLFRRNNAMSEEDYLRMLFE